VVTDTPVFGLRLRSSSPPSRLSARRKSTRICQNSHRVWYNESVKRKLLFNSHLSVDYSTLQTITGLLCVVDLCKYDDVSCCIMYAHSSKTSYTYDQVVLVVHMGDTYAWVHACWVGSRSYVLSQGLASLAKQWLVLIIGFRDLTDAWARKQEAGIFNLVPGEWDDYACIVTSSTHVQLMRSISACIYPLFIFWGGLLPN
jgi:hypothetical protein